MYTRGKRFILLAVAGTAVTCGASFALRDAAGPTAANVPHVSSALAAPLRAAQDAVQAKPPKLQEAVAKLKEAEANPEKTPYDEHIINVFAAFAYARLSDYREAEQAFAAQLNDGFTSPADFPRIIEVVAKLNYQLKNYARAAEFGTRALKESAEDEEFYILVSQAYYLNGQYDAVRKFLVRRIESLERQGREVPRQHLQLIAGSCIKLQDSACVTAYYNRLNTPKGLDTARHPILTGPEFKHDAMFQASASSQ
jgi:tetratricopeptide (TPR) repeat protein